MASNEFESKLGTLVEAVRASVTELRGAGFIPAKRPTPRPVPQSLPAAGKVVSLNPDVLVVTLADDQSEIEPSPEPGYRLRLEEFVATPTDYTPRCRRVLDKLHELTHHPLALRRDCGPLLRRRPFGCPDRVAEVDPKDQSKARQVTERSPGRYQELDRWSEL